MPINLFDTVFLHFIQSMPHSQSQTVVVENPMSVDESGKLVSLMIDFILHFVESLLYSPSLRVLVHVSKTGIWNLSGEQCCCWCHNRKEVTQSDTKIYCREFYPHPSCKSLDI